MNYVLSENAKEDLYRIYVYGVATFGQELAEDYFWRMHNAFGRISEDPFRFPLVNHIRTGYRRYVFRSDTIYFRIAESMVEIMAVIGSQDVDEWL